jgi:hypothetical protein
MQVPAASSGICGDEHAADSPPAVGAWDIRLAVAWLEADATRANIAFDGSPASADGFRVAVAVG